MNVPLRALAWAIRFFWIITLAFAVTCAYSATLINVDFGEPTSMFDGHSLGMTLPIFLNNRGYYGINGLNFTTSIVDAQHHSISEASSYIAQVSPQEELTLLHNISLDVGQVLTREKYLFEDSNLTLISSAYLSYANLVPVGLEGSTPIQWGAPLFNFTVGTPQNMHYDLTRLQVSAPVSFENHSPYFNVTGTIRIEILNDRGQLLGGDTTAIDVPSGNAYSGEFETIVEAARFTGSGQILVHFETEMFDYGPLVVNYG
jgi:hypothetical protein